MLSSRFRYALVLGLLTAIGPVAIDMYLPALPLIGQNLAATPDAVQASLMAFLLTLGVGQLLSGPLSDIYGRKRPLYAGLFIFIAGSIGCACAPDVLTLTGFRILQGVGACAVMVIPRAVVRDVAVGTEAALLMSLLMNVYTVSPILAPLAGSLTAAALGWRGIFGVIAVLALLAVVLVACLLEETRPAAARQGSNLASALAGYRTLLTDGRFVALALIASLTLASFFIYVGNSAFVFAASYGVSPTLYAVLFALNAVTFIVVSNLNGWLGRRFGLARVVKTAVMLHTTVMGALLIVTLTGHGSLAAMVTLLAIGFGLNGAIVPPTFVLAMADNPKLAGTASALIGTLNFAGGAVAVAVLAPFANATPLPMVAGIAVCSVSVLILAVATFGKARPAVADGAPS